VAPYDHERSKTWNKYIANSRLAKDSLDSSNTEPSLTFGEIADRLVAGEDTTTGELFGKSLSRSLTSQFIAQALKKIARTLLQGFKRRGFLDMQYQFMREMSLESAISMHWAVVDQDPYDLGLLRALYMICSEKYRFPEVGSNFTSRLRVTLICWISILSRKCIEWGLGKVDWWPLASEDDLMMLTPYMRMENFICVCSLNNR
jgi:hypothetical protein